MLLISQLEHGANTRQCTRTEKTLGLDWVRPRQLLAQAAPCIQSQVKMSCEMLRRLILIRERALDGQYGQRAWWDMATHHFFITLSQASLSKSIARPPQKAPPRVCQHINITFLCVRLLTGITDPKFRRNTNFIHRNMAFPVFWTQKRFDSLFAVIVHNIFLIWLAGVYLAVLLPSTSEPPHSHIQKILTVCVSQVFYVRRVLTK